MPTIAAACGHYRGKDNHCSIQGCWNYYDRCPRHCVNSRVYETCTLDAVAKSVAEKLQSFDA